MPISSPLEFLRSLSFGGLLSAGIAAVIFYMLPGFFGTYVSAYTFILFFGLLGAGLQNLIHKALSLTMPSISKIGAFYENLIEASALRRSGVITEEKYAELVDKIVSKRFLE